MALRLIFSSVWKFDNIFLDGKFLEKDHLSLFFQRNTRTGSESLDHLAFTLDFCRTSQDTNCTAATTSEVSRLRKSLLSETD